MPDPDTIAENHRARSSFVRDLVQRSRERTFSAIDNPNTIPATIVQFWDDSDSLPSDVRECMSTWSLTKKDGFEHFLFDNSQAGEFIHQRLGKRHREAYDRCYHPAMQSDYFRLCYVFVEGGCYVDADDVYNGAPIRFLLNDGRLKVQPLCYDVASAGMISPSVFTKAGAYSDSWIFYFNNNPLIAVRGHPLVHRALEGATRTLLEEVVTNELPEIQSSTGPGNLTKAIFDAATEGCDMDQFVCVLHEWEDTAKSKWELSYRNDTRNWRLSNNRRYLRGPTGSR